MQLPGAAGTQGNIIPIKSNAGGQTTGVHFNGFYCFILKFAKMDQGIYYLQQDGMPGEKPKFKVLQWFRSFPQLNCHANSNKIIPVEKS